MPEVQGLARWRSSLKRLLTGTPLFAPARSLWLRLRYRADRRAFRAAYPAADYILYSSDEIDRQHAAGFRSQAGQDHVLWTRYLSKRAPGTFVDIGANTPGEGNNSDWLERQGWTGYAFDPLRSLAPRWQAERRTVFVNAGISAASEQRRFVEVKSRAGWEHQLSAFEGFARPEDIAIYETETYDVPCAPLASFVPAEFHPEILLVDVEGAELIVLDGVDLARHRPALILIENVQAIGGDPALRTRIEREGYRLTARIGASDDLFERVAPAS